MLDEAYGHKRHVMALEHQLQKVHNTELTPSARVLHTLREGNTDLHACMLQISKTHHETLLSGPLDPELLERYIQEAAASIEEQRALEAADTESFDEYVARF